jgi:hypothetical protein
MRLVVYATFNIKDKIFCLLMETLALKLMYLRAIYVQTASQYFIFISCRICTSFFHEEFEAYL